MYPLLFSVGSRPVSSYTVVLGGALLTGLSWIAWRERRQRDGVFDLALVALLVSVICARLVHVLANRAYYVERPVEIVPPLDGGLSFHGGLVAGLATVTLLSLVGMPRRPGSPRRLLIVAGALVVPLTIGLLGGWLACLLRGCAYGRAIPPPQRLYTPDWPDMFGVHAFRLPSQALGIALAVALLLTAGLWTRRPGLFLIVFGIGDWLIAWTRGDLTLTWGPLLAVQWVDLAIIFAGIALERVSRTHAPLRSSAQIPSGTDDASSAHGSQMESS